MGGEGLENRIEMLMSVQWFRLSLKIKRSCGHKFLASFQ